MTARHQTEEQVLRAARKYARMKIFGNYVSDGWLTRPCGSQIEALTEQFKVDLLRDAEHMLSVMAADIDEDGKLTE